MVAVRFESLASACALLVTSAVGFLCVWLLTVDQAFLADDDDGTHAATAAASPLMFCLLSMLLCLPCCFIGGSLMLCVALGVQVPDFLLARIARLRCDVTPSAAKQV
jgi:hypothetical protein